MFHLDSEKDLKSIQPDTKVLMHKNTTNERSQDDTFGAKPSSHFIETFIETDKRSGHFHHYLHPCREQLPLRILYLAKKKGIAIPQAD